MIKKIKENTLIRFISFMKPRMFLYLIGLVGSSFSALVFNYLAAFGLKSLTDASINHNIGLLIDGVKFMAIGFLIFGIVLSFLSYVFESSVKKTTGDMRKRLFSHIQRLPMSYIENQHSGDLISRLTNDIQTAENIYSWQLLNPLTAIIGGIGSGIIIFTLNWKLGLIAVGFGLLTLILNTFFIKPIQKISDEVQKSLSNLTSKLSDILAGTSVIRIFNLVGIVLKKYINANTEILNWSMKRVVKNSELWGMNNFLGYSSFLGIIVISGIMVINKEISFGTTIAVGQLMGPLQWMFNAIGHFITQLQSSLAGARRIVEILDIPEEKLDLAYVVEKKIDVLENPIIEFKNVSFSYDGKDEILRNFNLKVYRGEVAAIVGLSGSGKTTLFKLLLGFYRPNFGEIYLFGKPISSYELEELRKLVAYVPQDNYLFTGGIFENIKYGNPNASNEDIINSAKSAYAYEFIINLPEGYKTQVGERGAHLSGGERQRIAIARALLKDAPILLLDEATSSLDSESERQVQQAIEVLMKGRTSLVVAHRLSTIQEADIIYVISGGEIVEKGTHEELIGKEGLYYTYSFPNSA